jgi:hypothetical protein
VGELFGELLCLTGIIVVNVIYLYVSAPHHCLARNTNFAAPET